MNKIMKEINEVLESFKGLSVCFIENQITISGFINFNRVDAGTHIIDKYNVKISIPSSYPRDLPSIEELGGKIKYSYQHVNPDKTLCLATKLDMIIDLGPNFKLIDWIEKFVIPFLFTYSYFTKYNVVLNSERSHGSKGILESYMDYFKVNTLEKAFKILKYISTNHYRQNDLCPCGSGKKIKKCHNKIILKSQDLNIINILKNDYKTLQLGGF